MMQTLGEFLSPEAGQARRKWLDESLGQFIPPELRGWVGAGAELNPVTNMERAGTAAQRMTTPGISGWDRMAAAGDMATNMGAVLAPVTAAKMAGTKGADAIVEALTAASPMKGAVDDFMVDEFGGVTLYHASPYDFTELKPSQYRGASFLASTPERAKSGARAGMNEMVMETSTVLPDTPLNIYAVDVDETKLAGLALKPAERAWFDALPSEIVGDDALREAWANRPAGINDWEDFFDYEKIGDRLYRYTKKAAPPSMTYQDAIERGRDIYGREWPHYGPGADESSAAARVLREGMGGYLVRDEAGLSAAVADPSIMRILERNGVPLRQYLEAQ